MLILISHYEKRLTLIWENMIDRDQNSSRLLDDILEIINKKEVLLKNLNMDISIRDPNFPFFLRKHKEKSGYNANMVQLRKTFDERFFLIDTLSTRLEILKTSIQSVNFKGLIMVQLFLSRCYTFSLLKQVDLDLEVGMWYMRTHMKNLKNKLHISNLKKEEFYVDPNFDFSDFIKKHYDSVLMLKVDESTNAYDDRIIEIHINMLVCLGFKMIMLLYYKECQRHNNICSLKTGWEIFRFSRLRSKMLEKIKNTISIRSKRFSLILMLYIDKSHRPEIQKLGRDIKKGL